MDIHSFLERKKISQADLSRELKTTPGNVNRWVKGEGVPSWELCRKLLLIGMTVEELFGIEYGKNTPENENSKIRISDEDLGLALLRASEILRMNSRKENGDEKNGNGTHENEAGVTEQHH